MTRQQPATKPALNVGLGLPAETTDRFRSPRGPALVLSVLLALTLPSLCLGLGEVLTYLEQAETPEPLSRDATRSWRVAIDPELVQGRNLTLAFNLPGGEVHLATQAWFEQDPRGLRQWIGFVEPGDRPVLLTVWKGVLSGFLSTEDGDYEIDPLQGELYLHELGPEGLPECGVQDEVGVGGLSFPSDQECSFPSETWVDLLALYSRTAMEAQGSPAAIESRILNKVAWGNVALLLSVGPLMYRVGHFEMLPSFWDEEGGEDGLSQTLYGGSEDGLSSKGTQILHQGTELVNGKPEPGDQFGSAFAAGDFNRDGFEDVVIGIPFEDISGVEDTGMINIVYGGSTGLLSTSSGLDWSQKDGSSGINEKGDRLGASLAAGDFNRDGYVDVAVGIPYEDIDGKKDTGRVVVLYGSSQGLWSPETNLHQDRPGVPGGNERDDRFGSSLAAGDFNGDHYTDLAVGVPGEDLDGSNDTGKVTIFFGSASGIVTHGSRDLHQGAGGLHGEDESDDRFGYSLSSGDFDGDSYADLAIGVPGEDIDGEDDTGRVQVVFGGREGLGPRDQTYDQGNIQISGSNEEDDLMGWSVAAGDFNGDGKVDLAVGIPGEDLEVSDTGRVIVLSGSRAGLFARPSASWHQGTPGIAGSNEEEDFFGWSLAAGNFDGDSTDDIVIGIPGEDIDYIEDSGRVVIVPGTSGGPDAHKSQNWYQSKSGLRQRLEEGDRFGAALGVGDFNGDGKADLIVGVPQEGVSDDANEMLDFLGSSREVRELRDDKGSDLIGMTVENISLCGFGNVLNRTEGNAQTAFQVTRRDGCFTSYAHEHGHNLGMQHDPGGGGTNPLFPWAFGHWFNADGGTYRTVMARQAACGSGSCERVPYFSNPDARYKGARVGIEGQRDNAKTVRCVWDFVANYR